MDLEEKVKELESRVSALEEKEKKKKREKIIKFVVGLVILIGFIIGLYLFIRPYLDEIGNLYNGF